jgi:cell wall-associated NlpC family hydrolase
MRRSASNLIRVLGLCAGFVSLQACDITPYQPVSPQALVVPPASAPASVDMQLPSRSSDYEPSVGSEIVLRAISLLGAPYKWGGSGPTAFDCSGLVQFIHGELGMEVPRTAEEQFRAATRVDMDELEPGDLLFFKIRGKRVSHVAIYAGSGRFVHAPQTGRPIELRTLDDGYYRPRLAGAGRLF